MDYQSMLNELYLIFHNKVLWIVADMTFCMSWMMILASEPIIAKSARKILADMAENEKRKRNI